MKRNWKARNSDTEKLLKVVIYRGENTTFENEIEYRNVEEYLKSLVLTEIGQFGNEGQKTKKQKIKNSKSQINTAISGNADKCDGL